MPVILVNRVVDTKRIKKEGHGVADQKQETKKNSKYQCK
jgi:hypothetical protein